MNKLLWTVPLSITVAMKSLATQQEREYLPQSYHQPNPYSSQPYPSHDLTALMGHPDVKERLKRYLTADQGDPNLIDTQGYQQSLLQWCVYKGYEDMVDQLIQHPKTHMAYVDQAGHNALYMAMAAEHDHDPSLLSKHFIIAEKILQALKDSLHRQSVVNQQDHRGITSLHMACLHHHKEEVKLLLKNGAFVDVKDHEQRTPLHFVCYHGDEDIIQLLLDYKADPSLLSQEGLSAYDYFVLGEAQTSSRRNPTLFDRLKRRKDEIFSQRRQDLLKHPSLKEFQETYTRKCSAVFLAYKCLESGDVQQSTSTFSVSNLINLLGGTIPLPGAGLVATGLSLAAGAVEDHFEAKKRCQMTKWFSTITEMEKAVDEGALSLLERYQDQIRFLTPKGAGALAEEAVARFITHMRSLSFTIDREKTLTDYAFESLLVSKESVLTWVSPKFLSHSLETIEGIQEVWNADDIFKKTEKTKQREKTEQGVGGEPMGVRETVKETLSETQATFDSSQPHSPTYAPTSSSTSSSTRPIRRGFFMRLFGCFAPDTQIRER